MKSWSKKTRIAIMMVLDTIFLAIELGVGYYVQSLALIADAFHMLNDIISLAVGLWAVNLARKESNDRYSYGWLRAEILGAFFNATFLIGLCVTIVLEAIQRFFDPPDISNPEVVLLVGCFGLASNLLGFWVLGGHGHSHGPVDLEAGHDHDHAHADGEHDHSHGQHGQEDGAHDDDADSCPDEDEEANEANENASPLDPDTRRIAFSGLNNPGHERSNSRGSARSRGTGVRGRANSGRRIPTNINDISIHPASFRNDIREIIAAQTTRNVADDEVDSDDVTAVDDATPGSGADASRESAATERTPLIGGAKVGFNGSKSSPKYGGAGKNGSSHSHNDNHTHEHHHARRRDSHGGHHHNAPRDANNAGSHGHSHGDMGMNAMVLHVIGDALGNIGVIITALVIWKTTWKYRMYADPIVSLFITLIILKSAIPLTKAASKILLQATPDHININDIREDIQDLEGILSCHHVHVWQLSDSQIIASLHIEVAFPISDHGGERYMNLARRVRKCLHGYGIHSATIQPEFRVGLGDGQSGHDHSHGADGHDHSHLPTTAPTPATTFTSPATAISSTAKTAALDVNAGGPSCLLDCVDDCEAQGCCSITSRTASRTGSPPGSSGNSEHGGHTH
ncbi:Zinc resistance conferring protein [Sporothrix eucalyptigena]|uniref:Zinc resistance conferring protein n=1 Tax=Sporothrix eucalyptigena TaxID=1812306 RepID=A0ABP0CJD1_9PEZI